MTETSRRYADWKAPPADGGWLIWPASPDLLRHTRENADLLSSASQVRVQNLPLPELRQATRTAVGCPVDLPIVVTGHQTELYHPGVWFKDVVIDAVASELNGRALHLAVDTDQVKHLRIRYPGVDLPVGDDPRLGSSAWSALVHPPSAEHLQRLACVVRDSAKSFPGEPLLPQFVSELGAVGSGDLSRAITAAVGRIDRSLGLRRVDVMASDLWATDAFALFTHHVASNADRFAADYDSSLNDFRARTRTRDPNRPMPNLLRTGESVELPFWLDDLVSGIRTRPTVFRDGSGWVLQPVDRDGFGFDPRLDGWDAARRLNEYLRGSKLRLAPRALTLTLFARLCLADEFVHGIGGGRYDQVTDQIIARHFGIEPPAFSVATATLLFPSAVGKQPTCLPCLLREGHRLWHSLPGGRKLELVNAIASAPRGSSARARLFQQMHRELADSPQRRADLERWRRRYDEARERLPVEQVEFSRELFFAVQPRDRLTSLIDAARSDLSA